MRILIAFLLTAACVLGQGNTGNIVGTVMDPSGAVVPGARIVVTNVNTGVQSASLTDGLGNYRVQFLQPGAYKVEAEVAGFKKFVRENIALEMTRELRVDVALETGAVTETVSVTAATPLIETETGALSATVEAAQVVRMPSLNRNPQDLRLMVPGVVLNRDGNTVTQGGLVRKDPYYIDGAHSSNHVWSGNPVNPNPDVLQEFKVLTNSFSAEYGETSGAIMASTTKAGTNEIHFTLFEFLRNDKLNAGNYFTHTRPLIRRNQWGGTVGGPVQRNKTFFFFDMQFTEQRGTQAYTGFTVPIADFRRGDFRRILGAQAGTDALGRPAFRNQIFDPLNSQMVGNTVVRTAFADNRIPASRLSPAAQKVQELYPAPLTDTPFVNYNNFGALKTSNWEYDLKFDHHFSDQDKIMARWSRRQFNNDQPPAFPDPRAGGYVGLGPGFTKNPGRQAVVNHVHIFGPRATNSLHLAWFQVFPKRTIAGFGVTGTEDLGIFGLPNGKEKLGTPEFQFQNFNFLGSTGDTILLELQNSNSLVNVSSLVLNRHSLKFGGEVRQIRTDNFQPNPGNTRWNFQPIFTDQRGIAGTGFDYASFLLGLPNNFQYRIFPGYFKSRSSVYAAFLQDDIRVSRRLTLNLGLRWDAPLWYHERVNRSGVFNLDRGEYQVFGQNGFRDTPWKNDWNNFGPRFGFAYTPLAGSRFVIRGGYGLFSVGTMSSGAFGFLLSDPIFADADVGRYATIDQVNWRTTLDRIPYEQADKTGRNATAVSVFPDDNAMSYFHQWNLNVQKEVRGITVEAGYAGTRGAHLHYGTYNLNAIPVNLAPEARGRFIAPYVRFPRYPNGVTSQSWIGSSSYHSLQLKAERRMAAGVGFLASYTFAKLIDVGQVGYRDPLNNRNLDRGVGPDDAPHRFTSGLTWELPAGRGRRWLTQGPATHLLGGWEVNGILTFQSGFALTPGFNINTCVCGSINRPNVARDPRLSGSQKNLNRWFDPEAFTAPPLYTIGNSGRGLFYGPGLRNLDLSLAKRFYFPQLRERANLEFRAESFNTSNTPYFANPNTTIGTATVGRITAVTNQARQIQMAMKFHW